MLTDDELSTLAGQQAFARGRGYCREGRIALSRNDERELEGEAEGSEVYALWLRREGAGWKWDCTCPAADGGAFCKHLVAAVLTAREENSDAEVDDAADPAPPPRASKRADDLADFLRAQPAERLSAWLLEFACEDATLEKRLALYRAAEDPAELKSALGGMLNAGGFLDHRRSRAYARRLDAVIAQLDVAIARDADTGRGLCEYALGRLLKIYARSDDSAGSIGDQLRAIAQRHVRACAAAAPVEALAKTLLALQLQDDWDLFPLQAYWNALGTAGQADYGKRIVAEFGKLPAHEPGAARWTSGTSGVVRRAEAFARASGDFDLLQRVLRRQLSRPHDHLRVLESLQEFDRPREALAWAEQAVRRFPEDDGLRSALAHCLLSAGLDADAVEQAWQAFVLHPIVENWDDLKRIAGKHWPTWRARALEDVASQESGDASLRAMLLEHDGDFPAAVALARECALGIDVLERLARRLERDMPEVAGEFYLRIAHWQIQHLTPGNYGALVKILKRAARCLPAERWRPAVAKVRTEHGRKPKLMGLLTQAGL